LHYLVGVVLLLAACAGAADQATSPPVMIVQEFVTAVESRDPARMLELMEPTEWRREIGAELRSYTATVEHVAFQDTNYEVLESSSDHAEVRLRSTVTYRIQGFSEGNQEIDVVVEVVQQDGEWYVRDFALPGPAMAPPEE
jgi:hypothetical protein